MNALAEQYAQLVSEFDALKNGSVPDPGREKFQLLVKRKDDLCSRDERVLLNTFRNRGSTISSVWDFVNEIEPSELDLQILREEVRKDYLPPVREGICRALIVKGGDDVSHEILRSLWLEGVFQDDNKHERWSLGLAVAKTAKGKTQVSGLVELLSGNPFFDDPFVARLRSTVFGRVLLEETQELVH